MHQVARALVTALLATTILVPAAPASAHGRLPRGLYACYQWSNGGYEDVGYSLRIMRDRRYAYKYKGDRVGNPGRFRHPSHRIVFKTGYLHHQGYNGIHHPGAGVELQLPNGDGTHQAIYCTTRR